ncbi:MAG: DoxX family membrane protein [Fimbriimonadaceae bacterium]|nr:DoxX family membrane protein [Alphaproteobacteria bacterium]
MSSPNYVFDFMAPVYRGLKDLPDVAIRVAAGLFFVPHGAQKLFGWFGGFGLTATGNFFEQNLGFSNGFLTVLAAGTVEFFGGLALALGLLTRVSAGALAILLLVALQYHMANGFFWTNKGYEYPLLWLVLVLAYWVKGGGKYSLDRMIGREF